MGQRVIAHRHYHVDRLTAFMSHLYVSLVDRRLNSIHDRLRGFLLLMLLLLLLMMLQRDSLVLIFISKQVSALSFAVYRLCNTTNTRLQSTACEHINALLLLQYC